MTSHDAARFLDADALAVRLGDDVPLAGAAPDDAAEPGEAAWIAARVAQADPARPARFGGALLVAPPGVDPALVPPAATVVVCERPRVAFSRLVAHAFAERTRPGWPLASPALPPDAVVGEGVAFAPGVVLGAGVEIGDGCRIGPHAALAHCTLGRGVEIGPHCTIGTAGFGVSRDADGALVPFPHVGRVVLEDGVAVGAGTQIDRGALGETRVGAGTRIDNAVHVAHNARIGRRCLVIAHAMIAGSVTVGDDCWIAPGAQIRNGVAVGAGATVGMGAVVVRDVPAGATVKGNPAR